MTSAIPPKPGFFARVKSCNYLPNVLMKKEALDADAAFSVSIDEQGCLGEGRLKILVLSQPIIAC